MGRRQPQTPLHGMENEPCVAHAARQGVDPLTAAFERRQFVVPWQGSHAIDAADLHATLDAVFHTPRSEPAVAYVHVPYCQNHCLFCGFFQNTWRPDASATYVADVVAEIALLARTPLAASGPIAAVYIGGGTPSVLDDSDLSILIANLRALLPLEPDCEITVEGRVHGFGLPKAIAALEAGANRISLGIQSFDTGVRRRLGRKANREEARAFLADLVALDRAAIGCDLIYGLPGQDEAIWRSDIQTAIALGLDSVSAYALNVWPGGPLLRAIDNGKVPAAGTIPFQARAYAAACDVFAASGWHQISQSHFVGSARERNRYNRLIKAGAICLAFGPGAGGQAYGYRWHNAVDLARRGERLARGRPPIDGIARMPALHRARSLVGAGLDDGDLDIQAVDAVAPGFRAAAAPLIADWSDAGLGELRSDRFRTTCAGAFWMTTLTKGLYAVLDGLAQAGNRDRT